MGDLYINISKQAEKIFEEYNRDLVRATNDAIDTIAKEAVTKLRNTSPSNTGKYARGWTIKREKSPLGINSVIVYNKAKPFLTHLLEFGHLIRNKVGDFGRSPAHPHIKPVEEWVQTELPQEIEKELSNI